MVIPEIAAIAAGAIELISQKFIKAGADELVKRYTKPAIDKIEELWKVILEKFNGNTRAEKALKEMEEGKDNPETRESLTVYLKDEMKEYEEFATKIRTLAEEINAGKIQDNRKIEQNQYVDNNSKANYINANQAQADTIAAEVHNYYYDKDS